MTATGMHSRLLAERTVEWVAPQMIEPTRMQEACFERLAARHGGIKVELFSRDGQPWAYVRSEFGPRYDVPPHGMEKARLNNDMAPYESESEIPDR